MEAFLQAAVLTPAPGHLGDHAVAIAVTDVSRALLDAAAEEALESGGEKRISCDEESRRNCLYETPFT